MAKPKPKFKLKTTFDTIRQSEEGSSSFLQRILENSTDLIEILDENLIIKYQSPSTKRILGYDPEKELIGKNALEFCDPDEYEYLDSILKKHLKAPESVQSFTYKFKHADGSWRILGATCHNLLNDPLINGFILNSRDITKRVKAEEELKHKNEFLSKIMSTAMNAIAAVDINTNFILVNERLCLITGYSQSELSGQPFSKLFSDKDLSKVMSLFKKSLKNKESISQLEFNIVTKKGKELSVTLSAAPMVVDGEVMGLVVTGEDMSKYNNIQSDLRNSRDQLEIILQGVDDGIVLQDSNGKIVYLNESALPLAGTKSTNEILGLPLEKIMTMYDFMHEDGSPIAMEDFTPNIALKGEKSSELSLMFKIKSTGEIKYAIIRSNPIFDNRHKVLYVINIIRDITEKKISNAKLKESEQRYKLLAESLPLLMWTTNNQGITDYYNDRWHEYTGIAKNVSNENSSSISIVHPDDETKVLEVWREAQKSQNKFETEFRLKRYDGEYRWHLARAIPIFDGNNTLIVWIGTATDIHDQKKIEQALAVSESKFRQIVSRNLVGIMFWNKSGDIVDGNDAFLDIVGYSRKDIESGKLNWIKMTPPEFKVLDDNALEEMRNTGNATPFQKQYIRKDGGIVDIYIGAAFVDDSKEEGIAFILDISNKKEAEDKIKASLLEKETLLKEIHHRVKNNLQIISSLLSLQSGTLKDKQILKMFQESQNRIKSIALIHERLYQSKDLARVDFGSYIRNLAANLFSSYGVDPDKITLTLSIGKTAIPIDMVIPLGLIINEILSNSLKYAFPQTRKGKISISIRQKDNSITLNIGDDGIGIPDSLDITNTTSLGMQLMNILSQQLNGSFVLERHEGTRYKFIFPLEI